MTLKAIVVDDEKLARQRLIRMLEESGENVEVIAEADNGKAALELCERLLPDLVFLDIQMPEMNGLEVAEKLGDSSVVIFTTAFDRYALQAFESNSIDYLLKPVEAERLKKAIRKARNLSPVKQKEMIRPVLNALKNLNQYEQRSITVKENDRVFFLKPEEIVYLCAEDRYVKIHTEKRDYWCSESLSALEEKLSGLFLRSHRAYLVNRNMVAEARRWFAGKYKLLLTDKDKSEIPLSKLYKKNFGL